MDMIPSDSQLSFRTECVLLHNRERGERTKDRECVITQLAACKTSGRNQNAPFCMGFQTANMRLVLQASAGLKHLSSDGR